MKLTVPKDVLHDVFLQLSRWDLDCVQAAAWTFHEVIEETMKNVCLRRLEGVYINDRDEHAMTIRIFSEGGKSITREFLPSLEYDFGTYVVSAIKSTVITFFHVRSSDAWTYIRKKMHDLKAPVVVKKLSFTDSISVDVKGACSVIEKFSSIKSLHLDNVKRLRADDVNDGFLRKCAEKGITDLRLLSCRLRGPQRSAITLDGIFAFVFCPRETFPESITLQLGYVQTDETFVYRLVEEFRSRRPDYCVQVSIQGVDMDAQELGKYAGGYTHEHDDVLWRIDSNPWANFIRLSQAFHLFWSRPRHTMLEPL